MSGDGLLSAIACRPATFTIHSGSSGASHAERLRQQNGGEAALLTIRGPGAVETSFLDCEGGYIVHWLARVSGDYTIALSLTSGENICGSPFAAHVSVPHADARRCSVSGIALNEAVAGTRSGPTYQGGHPPCQDTAPRAILITRGPTSPTGAE